jgi:hypothetical protein
MPQDQDYEIDGDITAFTNSLEGLPNEALSMFKKAKEDWDSLGYAYAERKKKIENFNKYASDQLKNANDAFKEID